MSILERLADWILRTMGLVSISDVARYEDFDAQMIALGVEDREALLRMASALAQSGVTIHELEDTALAFARGGFQK